MTEYKTRVVGAPNTLEHRVYIGESFVTLPSESLWADFCKFAFLKLSTVY